MYWESLGPIDWIVIAAIAVATLSVILLYRADVQMRHARYAAWHRWYFQGGGLMRSLMRGWGRGTLRLTDRRRKD